MLISEPIEKLAAIKEESGNLRVIKTIPERWDCSNDEPSDYIQYKFVEKEWAQVSELHYKNGYHELAINGSVDYSKKENVLLI